MHPIDTPANGSHLHRTPCDTAGITLILQPWHLHLTWTYNLLWFSWKRPTKEGKD